MMKKFLLLPLCLSIAAVATAASAETQSEMSKGAQVSSPSSYSDVWEAKIEDKMTSDAYYWASKGNIEKAKSIALDLEAKNLAKSRNIEKLKGEKSNSNSSVNDEIDQFLGSSVLSQKLGTTDTKAQEQSLALSKKPQVSVADQKIQALKERQDLFIKEITDYINKSDEKSSSDSNDHNNSSSDSTVEIGQTDNSNSDSGDTATKIENKTSGNDVSAKNDTKDFKFNDGSKAVVPTVISARIIDIRKGYSKVMFAVANPEKGSVVGEIGQPSFMEVRVTPNTKFIPVTLNFGETYNVKVKSYTPTKIKFEYSNKVFTAMV